mgnify:CR=1 FL=1
MTTGADIVKKALRKIGAHSIAAPANPEAINEGVDALNSMIQLWLSRSIDIGAVPLKVPGDNLGEPADTTNGVISNLALYMAPDFDNGVAIVSPDLRRNAYTDLQMITALYQTSCIPKKVISSTTPRGQGNRWGYGENPPYFNGVMARILLISM